MVGVLHGWAPQYQGSAAPAARALMQVKLFAAGTPALRKVKADLGAPS